MTAPLLRGFSRSYDPYENQTDEDTEVTVWLSYATRPAEGGPTISGTAQLGETLTVTVTDNDDPPPPPPGVRALVSNLYETPASTGTEFETVAQPFTTGSNPDGYVLTSVELRADDTTDDTTDDTRFQVQIVTLDGDGQPSAALYTLSSPGSIEDGPLTFTAPASANLAADTSYAVQVVISSANGGPNPGATLDVTPSWDEDLALYGWSIANTRFKRSSDTDPWSSIITRLVQMRIRGAFYSGPSNNATLAALTLADAADDSAIALNESVAAGTTAYTAEVEDGVETVTINAETADDGATVAFIDGSGAALADADANADGWQVRLDPSATTIQMTVTAENASTRTYTLTLVVIDTSDATLRSLSLSEVALSRTFSPDVTSYTASVADSVLSTTVTANPAQPEATAVVMLDGVEDSDGAVDLTEDSTSFSITVVVTAPNRTSTRTYTVTVNRGSVAVTGTTGGGGGGGGAPPVAVPSDADFDWNVTRDIESLDPDHDAPTDIWSDGQTLWVLQNSATGADTVFAYESDSGERRADREFELDRRNRFAHGIWSDGATVWVADSGQDTLFAYDLASGARLEDRDIELAEDNRDSRGVWSDGEKIYVLDSVQDAIFACDLESGELLAEYPLDTLNQSPSRSRRESPASDRT